MLAGAIVASGCTTTRTAGADAAHPGVAPSVPVDDLELPAPDGLRQVVLTRDERDLTEWERTTAGYLATAPAGNVGTNTRTVLLPRATPTVDHGACVTATHQGSPTQQGIVLRLRADGERLTGVSVTKNIWAGVDRIYNVTVWDSALDPPFRKLADFDLSESIDSGWPLPVGDDPQLCARVRGNLLELKVWPRGAGEPPWDDPRAARSTILPGRWVHEGLPGWYLGHLPPGGWARFEPATTWVEAPS